MTSQRRDMMADYVTVAERIQAFYERFPEGSLQSEIYLLTEEIVVMKSYAYRTADDARPGIGHSSMLIPGSTNFTRGSEIENCESSSVGRAIAMLGFEVKRGIASHDEIQNKQGQRQGPPEPRPMRPRTPVDGSVDAPAGPFENGGQLLTAALNQLGMNRDEVLIILGQDTIAEVTDYAAAWDQLVAQKEGGNG